MSYFVALLGGYLLGSLAFGYWIGKYHGVDIFKAGSCNPGATNVKRVIGPKPGNLVFLLDCGKGLLAVIPWLWWANRQEPGGELALWLGLTALAGALLGHSFSIFTGFRGGKGVATALGGLAALMPWAALIGACVWVIVFFASRYVSLASILMALSLPISNWLLGESLTLVGFALAVALLIVVRHRSNLQRLFRGREHRFGKGMRDSSLDKGTSNS